MQSRLRGSVVLISAASPFCIGPGVEDSEVELEVEADTFSVAADMLRAFGSLAIVEGESPFG